MSNTDMSEDKLFAIRCWVQAEIEAGIAGSQEGPDGYFGYNHAEKAEADRLFYDLVSLFNPSIGE